MNDHLTSALIIILTILLAPLRLIQSLYEFVLYYFLRGPLCSQHEYNWGLLGVFLVLTILEIKVVTWLLLTGGMF